MEQDKEFKDMLTKGAFEEAPSAFTDKVMKRIEATELYKPTLISPRFRKILSVAFVVALMGVLIITFVIKPADVPLLQYVKLPEVTPAFFNKALMYVSLFWLLILINQLTQKDYADRSHHNNFQQ